MKRRFLIIVVLCFFGISFNVDAYSTQTQRFINMFEKQMRSMDTAKKESYLDLIASILDAPSVKANNKTEVKTLVKELNSWIDSSRTTKKKSVTTTSEKEKASDWKNYQTLQNIDFTKVRDTWLSWHNELRASKWVEPLAYHSDLEKSANAWATYLANNSKTSWTHARQESDWYYNYNSIKEWFWDQWIYFSKETWGKSAFSESVGYRVYRCSWWDCTQNLIDVMKKIFDSFANEWENWAHYKAIAMPHYHNMWIGFQIDPKTNYVFMVIHYAEKIVEG